MGQDCGDNEIPREVFELHRQYREFLRENVEGYVIDRNEGRAYLLVSSSCNESILEECTKHFDYNFGILHIPKELVGKLSGEYKSFEEMDAKRCA